VQHLVRALPFRDVSRRSQKFFWFARCARDRADQHVEPHWLVGLNGLEEPNKPAHAAFAGGLDRRLRRFAIRSLPEINPG